LIDEVLLGTWRHGTVIENVTLISPERATPLLRANVVIRDGQIVEVGTNLVAGPHARRIDGSGRFLIPGLIDSHVHVGHSAALDDDAMGARPDLWPVYRAQVPRAYLAFGFTSVVDLDTTPNDQAWFEGTRLHTDFCSCGRGIEVATGHMAFNISPPSSPNFPNLVYEPKEADHRPLREATFLLHFTAFRAKQGSVETQETHQALAGISCL
jgi:hypothetical protein